MDELYPFSFEELPDRIESGNNYIRILLITDYPKRAYGNWLSELKRKKGIFLLYSLWKMLVVIKW